jgi:hypothetical protein
MRALPQNHQNPAPRIAFRKKIYRSLDELQTDLDHWLMKFNQQRPHSGRHCYVKTPVQTFCKTIHIVLEKIIPAANAGPDLSDSEDIQSEAVR